MKKKQNKRDPYVVFLEYALYASIVIFITWIVCDMAFK